jgi:hypothetical protein
MVAPAIGSPRQPEVCDERLPLGYRDRINARKRAALAELLIDITALRRPYRPSPRRNVREQERSIVVGGRIARRLAAPATLIGGEHRLNLRSPHRRAGRRVDDAAADGRRSGAKLRAPTPAAALLRAVGTRRPSAAALLRAARPRCPSAAAATGAGVGATLTACRVRPTLTLAEQRRVGNCHGDNEEEGETDDEAHALLT